MVTQRRRTCSDALRPGPEKKKKKKGKHRLVMQRVFLSAFVSKMTIFFLPTEYTNVNARNINHGVNEQLKHAFSVGIQALCSNEYII